VFTPFHDICFSSIGRHRCCTVTIPCMFVTKVECHRMPNCFFSDASYVGLFAQLIAALMHPILFSVSAYCFYPYDRIVGYLYMGTYNLLRSIAQTAMAAVIGVTISDRFVRFASVIGISMHPTFTATSSVWRGDVILAERWCLEQYNFSHGDVVLFRCPSNHKELFVKRLIALPGEWLWLPGSLKITKIPEGHCWVEGDNASCSWDSRAFGPVSYFFLTSVLQYYLKTRPGGERPPHRY